MSYLNRNERRASIVNAAVAIILKDGIGAATVRGVAKALDAAPGQIHHHFASADALRAEAFRALWTQLTADFGERLKAMAPRDRLITALIGDVPDYKAALTRLWNDSLATSSAEPLLKSAVADAVQDWIAVLAGAIEEGVSQGIFLCKAPSWEVATHLASYCLGMDILAGLGLPEHSEEAMRARVGAVVDEHTKLN